MSKWSIFGALCEYTARIRVWICEEYCVENLECYKLIQIITIPTSWTKQKTQPETRLFSCISRVHRMLHPPGREPFLPCNSKHKYQRCRECSGAFFHNSRNLICLYLDVSENSGFSPKSSIWIGFSIINHPFWGTTIYGNIHICSFVWWRCFFSLQGHFILSNCWVQFWPPSIKKKSTSLPSFETGENPLLDDDSKSTSTTRTSGHESWKKLLLSMIHGASGIKCVKAMIDKTKATSVNETLAFIACNHCELTRTHFLAAWIQANC